MNMYRKRIENCDAHFTTQTWQKCFVTHAGKSQWRVWNGTYKIDEETVVKRLKSLKENKSPGPDMVSPDFVKELAEDLCKSITTIFKTPLKSMKIPNEWKKAQDMSAIYKKLIVNWPVPIDLLAWLVFYANVCLFVCLFFISDSRYIDKNTQVQKSYTRNTGTKRKKKKERKET